MLTALCACLNLPSAACRQALIPSLSKFDGSSKRALLCASKPHSPLFDQFASHTQLSVASPSNHVRIARISTASHVPITKLLHHSGITAQERSRRLVAILDTLAVAAAIRWISRVWR
jgi:hypothetical protein